MSLSLNCPNCGGSIGSVDNGKEEYHKNSKGENGCPHCHSDEYSPLYPFKAIGVIFSMVIILVMVVFGITKLF